MIGSLLLAAALNAAPATETVAPPPPPPPPKAARSVHFTYVPQVPRPESVMATVTVRETYTNSYFMVIGWSSGYCGVQDLGALGRVFIFSVWDPGDPFDFEAREDAVAEEKRVKILYSHPLVTVTRFQGEGTGAKAMVGLNWQVDGPLTVRVDAEPDGPDRMAFSCSLCMDGKDAWQKLVTLSTLVKDEKNRGVVLVQSFVEDFWRNGESAKHARCVEYRDVKMKPFGSDTWVTATKAHFTGDDTPTLNVDAYKTPDGAFCLKTGGATVNSHVPLWGVVE